MPPPAERCENCKYWTRENGWGQCHRHAPAPTILCNEHPHDVEAREEAVFPRVPADEWCGEYAKVV